MPCMAVFVRRWTGRGFGQRRFLGHVYVNGFYVNRPNSTAARQASEAARKEWPRIIRSCDYVEAANDGGKRRYYGTGAPSPMGTGTL